MPRDTIYCIYYSADYTIRGIRFRIIGGYVHIMVICMARGIVKVDS